MAERSTAYGNWYNENNGLIVIAWDGSIKWLSERGYYSSGYVHETVGEKGKDLPIIAVIPIETTSTAVYELTVQGNTLTMKQVGGAMVEHTVSRETRTFIFTLTKQD